MTLTSTKLPYLHKNARSRRITTAEVREVFAEEVTRGLDSRIDRDEYLRKVMP
ncbi:putative gp53.1 [Mycolicibacterium hassiacum DSM 44199]|uniref:Putative gp53.1 n=1 Tax=Mycolicibacterium hassiacum (strain DSM 44199 / CIP 105218 / JCM 12690 / 3849) TaxID=1122247 RepID=K5BAY7_MYCHD|nr:hypothetical protein SEA_JOURNEY13_49 [Mycobacterium phage Journey13]EKF23060.1 putative gp53.1 [Mycolicibacterium hassiacum DSM 44199]MDA4086058.1 hypothetical protein [Mycolicibacterium hassiacum DSM 44199]VCT89515.1 hypothetical protein MHAS_01209 [Mycolicibacterium hassiacum DSM 44199]